MDGILAQLNVVHPWLDDIVISVLLIVVAILLWFAFSFPANILYRALLEPVEKFSCYIHNFYNCCLTIISWLQAAAERCRNRTVELLKLNFIFDQNEAALKRRISHVAKKINIWSRKTNKLGRRMQRDVQKLSEGFENFSKYELGTVEIEVPPADILAETSSARRRGMYLVVLSIPIMIALVGVNTLMLREFFSSFIDEYVSFGMGIKLSTVLALFFTLAEITLGVLLYQTQKKSVSTTNIRTPLTEIMFIVFIVGLAFLEGVLYLFLSASFSGIKLSMVMELQGFEFVTATWLALFGPIIVGTLAATGHMLVNGFDQIVEAGHTKQYRKEAASIVKKVDKLKKSLEIIEDKHKSLVPSLDNLLSQTQKVSTNGVPSLTEHLLEGVSEIKKVMAARSETQRELYQVLSDDEGLRHFYKYSFLALGGGVVIGVFTWLQMHYLFKHEFFSGLPLFANTIIAAVQAVAIPLGAYMITAPVRTATGGKRPEVIRSPHDLINIVFGVLIIVSTIYFSWLLTLLSASSSIDIGFFVLLVCIGVLVLYGRALSTFVTVLWADIRITFLLVAIPAVMLVGVGALLLNWVFVIASWIIYVIAFPSTIFKKRYFSNSMNIPAVASE